MGCAALLKINNVAIFITTNAKTGGKASLLWRLKLVRLNYRRSVEWAFRGRKSPLSNELVDGDRPLYSAHTEIGATRTMRTNQMTELKQ